MEKETLKLKSELEQVTQDLIAKNELLLEDTVLDRLTENDMLVTEKEVSSDISWFLLAIMTIITLLMVMLVFVLCVYIKTQKRQRRNAMDVEQRSARKFGGDAG